MKSSKLQQERKVLKDFLIKDDKLQRSIGIRTAEEEAAGKSREIRVNDSAAQAEAFRLMTMK